MDHDTNIDVDHNSDHVTPAYHLGYADGLAGEHPDDERADYQRGWRDGQAARNAPGGTPAQLRRLTGEHRMAAIQTRAEELGLGKIVELDLKSPEQAAPVGRPRRVQPRTTIDRSSVGYGRRG